MQRIHNGSSLPKYVSGKWSWDDKTDSLHFEPHQDLERVRELYVESNGYKFRRTLNQIEEAVFRQDYVRSESAFDTDTVSINDIRDLVLFLMPKEFLTMYFLEFMHKPVVHRLLHSLIIYFDYFLRLVEFVLIRRDELSGKMAQIQSQQSIEMKKVFSKHLSQYRILVARNYSVILKGDGDMAKFYHLKPLTNTSAHIKDRILHEQFLAVIIQIVWIAMHRRAYDVIDMEMNRLFRSEHFVTHRPGYMKFTPAEKSLLYGRKNKICNYRLQVSPLILELEHVAEEDWPILWIGERKYRGNNIGLAKLELEYIVPDTQLHLIDVAHGILGHPKRFYDTTLELNWPALRHENYSLENDPYHIKRQPTLEIPNLDKLKANKVYQNFPHIFKIFNIYEQCKPLHLHKWLQREQRISAFAKGKTKLNIYVRCEQELERPSTVLPVSLIRRKYFRIVSRLRKEMGAPQEDALMSAPSASIKPRFQATGGDYFFSE